MPKDRPCVASMPCDFEVGGVGPAAAHAGQVVALAAGDLRVEHAQQGRLQILVRGQVESHLVRVHHPIQVAPHLAAVQLLRALGRGQAADGGDDSQRDRHVGVVLVGQVVGVDELGVGCAQDRQMSSTGCRLPRVFDDLAGIIQQHLGGILADDGGFLLLFEAHHAHFFVGVIFIEVVPRRAAPIGHDHAGEPQIFLLEALQDRRGSHDLDIVLVGADRHVGGARQGLLDGQPIGDEDFSGV